MFAGESGGASGERINDAAGFNEAPACLPGKGIGGCALGPAALSLQ